jgi:hypothetical protein
MFAIVTGFLTIMLATYSRQLYFVPVEPSEDDVGINFLDSNNGSISGSVKDDNSKPNPEVTVTLVDNEGIRRGRNFGLSESAGGPCRCHEIFMI